MVRKLGQRQSVHFYFDKVNLTLKNRRRLKDFISTLINKEKRDINTLNYIFCSDKALLKINRKYLGHDFYTDVITFDLSSSPKEIFADIYISAERVRANAKELEVSLKDEIHRVMFHGLLHLCGYKDKTKKQQVEIKKKENYYLSLYFH
jgi:probable rRNA maturation factor